MEEKVLGNRYRIEERIGSGGMALVFRAHDSLLERKVSIKLLRGDYSKDPSFRDRFLQEAQAVANLTHPNIVTVYDFGYDADRLFIVMEYVPGEDLKAVLQQRGRLGIEESVQLMIQACAGVGYAHRAGLVHCDIKPHNMLVTPDVRLKVTDFGIARALASIHPEEKNEYVWGSPQYFSPEQASGGAPSPASDVYSLGVVLYETLTGRLPYADTNVENLSRSHREAMPVSPRRLNSEIPPSLEQIVLKVLAKEPSSRYRTADQLGRVLILFSQGANPNEPPVPASVAETIPPVKAAASAPITTAVVKPGGVGAPDQPARSAQPSLIDEFFEIDWGTILLSLLALIAVGGLIPFWLWIYFLYNPPTP
ncbi:MAG TPA: protein kinase [Anaerolineales bacterium]|nr:protein kinase [Anaerolineales bacterium]